MSEDDITFEENNEVGESDGSSSLSPEAKIKRLKEQLKKCGEERGEYLAASQRFKADYVNLKRESEKEKGEIIRYAREGLLHELIDLADTFEIAFANKPAWEKVDENWRRGVEYIYAKLTAIFDQNGLAEINPLHQAFDPALHHSVASVDTDKAEQDNIVLSVVAKGYKLNGKVIRPAQVEVGYHSK